MLFYLTFRIFSSLAAFLYPGYASYKTLSQRPASEVELERWLMYWSVLGCIIGIEFLAEWLMAWVPFYYAFKTLFLLYLALPQTQGASYIYIYHLQPFLYAHETQIDATLASVRSRTYAFVQSRARMLWELALTSLSQPMRGPDLTSEGTLSHDASMATGAPPRLGDPVSGPVQLLGGLWRAYGPVVLASGAALLNQTSAPSGLPQQSQSALQRRRQLEAELAALQHEGLPPTSRGYDADGWSVPTSQTPGASGSVQRGPGASSTDLRDRHRFEEVDVPSDSENDSDRPPVANRASWFGWGAPTQGGYERVKSE